MYAYNIPLKKNSANFTLSYRTDKLVRKQFSLESKINSTVGMVATLICPTSCGFSRVAAFTIVRKTTETLYRENEEGMAKFKARSMQELRTVQ